MKILMVRPTKCIGGAEIYNLNLINGSKKYSKDIKFFFITTLPKFAKKIKFINPKVKVIGGFNEEVGTKRGLIRLALNFPKFFLVYLRTIFKINKKEHIDLICFQSATEKIFLTLILKILGYKIVWLEHGAFFIFPKAKEVLALYKFMSRFADRIITSSYDSLEDLTTNGVNPKKVIAIQTGIDEVFFSPLTDYKIEKIKNSLRLNDKEYLVGYVGSITKEKGIEEFLETANLIIQKCRGIKFFFVGEGLVLNWAKDFVEKNKFKRQVIFTGFRSDIRQHLGIFDIFFFPTYNFEAISLSLMEAMAMGVPVVARDIGGNRELVVHEKTGYLFKNESNEEVAKMIIKLLKDREKREKMGKLARERIVKYFNLERWTKEMQVAFESCLENEKKS